MIGEFSDCLTKASRKGCCLWASTQRPSFLCQDGDFRILALLQNKIVHKMISQEEVNILLKSLTNFSESDKDYIRENLDEPLPHSALLIGSTSKDGNQCVPLSPIMVKIDQPSKK